MIQKIKHVLSEKLLQEIRENYNPRRAKYILSTPGIEENLLAAAETRGMGTEYFLALAKTQRIMQNRELAEKYDTTIYSDHHHHGPFGSMLIRFEGNRLYQKSGHDPTNEELSDDFKAHKEGLRGRILYCLMHPDKVNREE